MIELNFGILIFLPPGWLIMAFVILFESLLMSKILNKTYFDKRIYRVTTATNVISGIISFLASSNVISDIISTLASLRRISQQWDVFWFPWVSKYEVWVTDNEIMKLFYIYYACAFVLTLLIEILTNWLFLRKFYKIKELIIATIIVNILSYIVGTFVLYSYSFGVW